MDRPKPPRPAIVVHGGAGAVGDDVWNAHRDGVGRAVAAGWDVLTRNGSALDAVETAVALLEDEPIFNAGTGSVLCRDGSVEMDAAVMDGRGLDVGAVTLVRRVKNPVRLARRVMGSEHVLLAGEGAEAFAREKGIALCPPEDLVTSRQREKLATWLARRAQGADPDAAADTVGAVAVDRGGNIAAACSTGGTRGKRSGRVGDSPIAGAGLYADNRVGAATATGVGEAILRVGLSRNAVLGLPDASAQDAAWLAVRSFEDRVGGRGGVIVLSRDGSIGYAFNTPRMAVAFMDGELAAPCISGKPIP
jgi:beta-aspartyl-peptidase (threonine type)